jgi:crotonobetainyl-CoA:carnitine CoA-transferase CaiB-like acyl-CoA transferase
VLTAALEKAKVAWGEIRTNQEVLAAPGVAERGVFTEIPDGAGGQRGVVQSPYRFSDAASGARGPAPHMGQHNHEILAEWLGMQPDAIAELADKEILRTHNN